MAATLIEANQNSNSPYDLTEMRFVTVSNSIIDKLMTHAGSLGNQKRTKPAPATASSATTMTQKYQYIQPVRKPASSPSRGRSLQARRAVFVKRPHRRQRDGHFAEHAHHQHDQQPRDHEGNDRRGSGRLDDHAAADEQTRRR